MATIDMAGQEYSRSRRSHVGRIKKHSLKIDMTPMVDLGFLLISFFVITVEMSKPNVTKLNMPKESTEGGTKLGESNALTVLIGGGNNVLYYHGSWEDAVASGKVYNSNFSAEGLRKIIIEKQQRLDNYPVNGEGREGLMLLIKPSDISSYGNVINALDEALINGVKKYAIVKISGEESLRLQAGD